MAGRETETMPEINELFKQLLESNQEQFRDLRQYIHNEMTSFRDELRRASAKVGELDVVSDQVKRLTQDLRDERDERSKLVARLTTIENGQELGKLVQRWIISGATGTLAVIGAAVLYLVIRS